MVIVDLPVLPPLEPMLAKAQVKVPDDAGVWSYEPKWDGFRALVFRDGDDVVVQSRSGKELGRYFPELLDSLRDELADRCVLDGEVVVPREIDGRIRLDWESLSQRRSPRKIGSSCWPTWNRCGRATKYAKVIRAGGTRRRTSAGFRCAPNGYARWRMTRWRATRCTGSGFGTR